MFKEKILTKDQAIDYIFKDMRNRVKEKNTGIIWGGIHMSSSTTVILDPEEYNRMPECDYIVLEWRRHDQ